MTKTKLLLVAAIPLTGLFLAGFYLLDAFRDPAIIPVLGKTPENDSSFVFLSDTQSPLWPETFVLDENRNEEARALILREILSLDVGAVFHAGDIVALGFNQSHWEPIDRFTEQLSLRDIPFFPVPGNHEYMIFGDRGIDNFKTRYPYARETGYEVRVGPLAVVLLNSNFSELSRDQITTQRQWFTSVMETLAEDALVRGIIVTCHHAPFTNSRIVDPSPEVQNQFVPGLLASAKALVFITGHCHAFEDFIVGGKHFLVSGGGGGLQQPLLMGADRRKVDRFIPPTETRMFHFLKGTITTDSLRIEIRMLREDMSRFETAHSLVVPLRPAGISSHPGPSVLSDPDQPSPL